MSFVWNHDEHVHTLLEEIYDVLKSVKRHQLTISNEQCRTVNRAVDILGKMIEKQNKLIEEIKISSHMQQIRYEATLNILAEQQRQTIEFLQKQVKESFINIS